MAITIPDKLLERLRLLGLDEAIYSGRSCKCMLSREELPLTKVPWYGHAYYTDAKNTNEGSIVFDPVSLVPCLALEPKGDDCILDMCAAPGTKTFILSFLTGNKANITANDVNLRRVMG